MADKDIHLTIHERIRQRREKLGLKPVAVAHHLGMTEKNYLYYEGKGGRETKPPLHHLPALAEILETSVSWIQTGVDLDVMLPELDRLASEMRAMKQLLARLVAALEQEG